MATSPEDLLPVVYLVANRVAPPHEGVEMGIGDATIIKALAEATGRKEAQVKSEYKVRVTLNSGRRNSLLRVWEGRGLQPSRYESETRGCAGEKKCTGRDTVVLDSLAKSHSVSRPPLSGVWRLGIGCKDFSDDSAHHVHSAAPHMCQTARPV